VSLKEREKSGNEIRKKNPKSLDLLEVIAINPP
jgi:hypothetical protein